jgi:eukaryotic-like serine/threonine-protein kinase
MRCKYLAPLIWIFLGVSYLVGQNNVALLRGNAARTGEFGVSGVSSFDSVLWKSLQIFKKIEINALNSEVNVLGTKGEYETSMPQWNNLDGFSRFPIDPFKYLQESAPLTYEKSIFFSLNFGEGFVVSLDVGTGKPNWTFRCPKCNVSPPVIYKDLLFVSSKNPRQRGSGKIYALNVKTGAVEWAFPLDKIIISLIAPTIYDGVLYFFEGSSVSDPRNVEGAKTVIHALDIAEKTIKWSFNAKGIFDTPAISDGMIFAGSNKDFLYAIDLDTGKEKWRFKAAAHAPVVREGTVYFSDYDNLYAVDAKTGLLKWKKKAPGTVATLLAVSKSAIFYGGDNFKFYCMDVATGNVKWSTKFEGYAFEPVIAKDRVFAGGTEQLLMLDAETGKSFPTVKLGQNRASTPAFGDGYVIVANDDGYLFAIKQESNK